MTICRSAPALAGGSIVFASAPGLLSTTVRHKTIFFTVAGMLFGRLTPPAPRLPSVPNYTPLCRRVQAHRLPDVRGSVDPVRYRAATIRERFLRRTATARRYADREHLRRERLGAAARGARGERNAQAGPLLKKLNRSEENTSE